MILMIGASLQLAQLAFGNVLNAIYSLALVSAVVVVWRALSQARASQQQWYNQWESVSELCHKQLDEIKQVEQGDLVQWMRSGWLTDLGARLEAGMPLPAPETTSEQMMLCALQGKPFLFEQTDLSKRWERLPGVAILLGLLGTFFGLTSALTQLPFGGDLKQLSGGLQLVLPLMGTAFWTSVCGLLASLLLRYIHTQTLHHQERRVESFERLQRELSQRCLRELYPRLGQASSLPRSDQAQAEPTQARLDPSAIQALVETLASQQRGLLEKLEAALAPLQQELKTHAEALHTFPGAFGAVSETLVRSEQAMSRWTEQLTSSHESFVSLSRQINEAVEPIAHTERLLGERISSLTRQHEAMTASIQSLAEREEAFPEKLKEILKLSLRPAHQSLQRTSRSLQSSLELVFEWEQKERETQRRLFQDLGDRFASIDRLNASFERSARELQQIADSLIELSNRLRFRVVPLAQVPEEETETPNDRALDREIEQLLEGFEQPRPDESGE